MRVALSKPIHAITARIGPPSANHGSFTAKPSSCNVHSTLQATPPNLASNPRFPFRILSCSFGKKLIFSKVARQNPERKAWVRGYTQLPLSHILAADAEPPKSVQRLFLCSAQYDITKRVKWVLINRICSTGSVAICMKKLFPMHLCICAQSQFID